MFDRNLILSLGMLTPLLLASCSSKMIDENNNNDNQDDLSGFVFNTLSNKEYTRQTDHLGLSLISTQIYNRSDAANCAGPGNKGWLFEQFVGLVETQRLWVDEIVSMGFPPCMSDAELRDAEDRIENSTPDSFVDYFKTLPCLAQSVARTYANGETYSVPAFLLTSPDVASVDISVPAGFPNGRHPADQINDMVIGMGLIDLDELPVTEIRMNKQNNDVPFRDDFPYLADRQCGAELDGDCSNLQYD